MQNFATADLASATVRVRHFSGRSPEQIAADLPILPLDAPGLPPVGPSFRAYAHEIGDPQITPQGKNKKILPPPGPYLTALVRSALYIDPAAIRLRANDDDKVYYFLPGLVADTAIDAPGSFGTYGPMPCRLMVVGKCLGPTEAASRRPFSGPGSRPLWEAWTESGIPTPSPDTLAYLTNLIHFSPPVWAMTRLPKDWVADGLHLLYQEVVQVRPEVMWVLGADALKALFGSKAKVDDYRGRVVDLAVDCRPTPDAPEDTHVVRVVVSDHPAAVARDPDLYPLLLHGARSVAILLGAVPAASSVPLDHRPVYTVAELETAVAESIAASSGGGYLSFDCEWEGGHPTDPGSYLYTAQWSHAPGHARVVFFRHQGGALNTSLPLDKAVPLLRQLFCTTRQRRARLVAHFGKADLPWLDSIGVDLYPDYVGPETDDVGSETYFKGGFDTYVAAHAVSESDTLKLEVLCANVLGLDRWDAPVLAWRDAYCKEKKIKKAKLGGYGNMPEAMMLPYAAWDCDATGRLYLHLNGDPKAGTIGSLDHDRFGNSARRIFGIRMRAWAAWAEMERTGILVDVETHHRLRDHLSARRDSLITELRDKANWHDVLDPVTRKVVTPGFDPGKPRHRVEFLFGEQFLDCDSVRPPGALSLYLQPFKATDTTGQGKLWTDAIAWCQRKELPDPKPAADKETLIHRAREHPLAALLRDIDFLGTAMKILFRKADEVLDDATDDAADDLVAMTEEHHERGLLAELCGDGRVRSTFGLVETGRGSSSRPNCQNFSGSVDEHYDRIMEWGKIAAKKYGENHPDAKNKFVSRSLMIARPGWYLVNTDLKGAEIAAAAWSSGDPLLIEHARLNTLPESDPRWLDLHSDLAKTAFNLTCTLQEVKTNYKALRTAAKRARFGHYYGASPETILRQALEEADDVTLDQIEAIVHAHDKKYPVLAAFFTACRSRVRSPGWLQNGSGGYRRFRRVGDRDLQAKQEREAQNWSCQGLVADVMNTALGNLWYELRRRKMMSRIVLSVHDSIMLEAPPHEVPLLVDELLPLCITERAPVIPASLDGRPIARGPYHFGIDTEVCRAWGIEVPEVEWRAHANA